MPPHDEADLDDRGDHASDGADAEALGALGRGKGGQGGPLSSSGEEESVGYKRPPSAHRFKPGQSGNAKGRAKGAKGMKSILTKEFNERVRITEGGKTRTISKMELMVKRLTEKGVKGDYKSITKLIELGLMVLGTEDEIVIAPTLTRDEQAIIDQAKKRRLALARSGRGLLDRPRPKTRTKPAKTSKKEDKP